MKKHWKWWLLLLAPVAITPFLWTPFNDLFIQSWIYDWKCRPEALEDQTLNGGYDSHWRTRSHPRWISDDQIVFLEKRMFSKHARQLFTPPDLPRKTEFWLIEESVDGKDHREKLLLAQEDISDADREEGTNHLWNSLLLKMEIQGPDVFINWKTSAIGNTYFYLLTDGKIVWSNSGRKKGRQFSGRTEPLLFDWTTRRLLWLQKYTDLFWYQLESGKKTPVTSKGPTSSDLFTKNLWLGGRLFHFEYDEKSKTVVSSEILLGKNIIARQLGTTVVSAAFVGAAFSADGKYIALGGVGIFQFSPEKGIDQKVSDLELLYPDWAPSGHRLVGLMKTPSSDGNEEKIQVAETPLAPGP